MKIKFDLLKVLRWFRGERVYCRNCEYRKVRIYFCDSTYDFFCTKKKKKVNLNKIKCEYFKQKGK